MRFAVDASLGKLGRLLRSAGFDTLCQHEHVQQRFWERLEADRVILTRTQAIRRQFQHRHLVFILDNDPLQQFRQVVAAMDIHARDIRLFSRCLDCNTAIVRVERESVRGRVPVYVWHQHLDFHECPRCERIFWAGSHHERVCRRFGMIFQHEERQFHA